MKKYVLAASVAAALMAVAPTVAHAAPSPTQHAAVASHTAKTSPIRVVQPGERVQPWDGWELWLTEEGKHWTEPDGIENFRSVVDGNIDMSRPGVSLQMTSGPEGAYHTGIYYGTTKAARVVVTDHEGTTATASLLKLPGKPGWGVYYAYTPPTQDGSHPDVTVSVYDRKGRLLTELVPFGQGG
ncbi:hypothetical protein [Streptomyces sp. TRM64462]|uniref:hypothetical protein n=1 Tax=Streptomyces sp. TRM64462 TaxID=2741726 RepID=UPI001586A481|nr:hypothetical protein [Streptomyces sp. TRM64462]